MDAELARARLEEAGIPSALLDRHVVSIQWLYSGAIGGIKVAVEEAEVERARQVLQEDRSGDLRGIPEAGPSATEADRCPRCGSADFHPSRVQRKAAALSLLTSLPLVAWRRRWVCDVCGETWKRSRAGAVETPPETLEAEEQVREGRRYPLLRVILAILLGLAILDYVQM